MSITELYSGLHDVNANEWSMTSDSAAVGTIGTAGAYQFFADVSDMMVGDELRFRVYEKVRATDSQRVV